MRVALFRSRFMRSTRAMAAVEFALVLPVLLILTLVGVQVITYVNAVRKVEQLATSISEMISQATPPSTSTIATVNQQDLHFSYDSGLVVFPYLMFDAQQQGVAWWQDIYIDYASVQFVQVPGKTCPPNGDQSKCYVANVVWTSTGTTGPNNRACTIPQLAMDDTASPNKLYLPRSVFGPGSVIVIDIVYTFNPTFAGNLLPALRIARSVYVQPRYATLIKYDTTGNDGIATECLGY